MNNLFPIFLKPDKLRTLIVGGGNVGLEKIRAILDNCPDALITLVAPSIKEEIIKLSVQHKNINFLIRKFQATDLINMHLVICATDDKDLNNEIYGIARSKNILINVADTPQLCDFYLGSIVQKGDLKIAISTNGKSPTFAKRLKETLNEALNSNNINELLNSLSKIRDDLKGDFNEKVTALNELTSGLTKKNKSE